MSSTSCNCIYMARIVLYYLVWFTSLQPIIVNLISRFVIKQRRQQKRMDT
ncbi:hypothetical protein SLEP1_g29972 [Rubroshorea leprosula]|uniref:Uncharacterized protein n=1 Tax=Rubroshorea leprosula TaxID=152421 RepID=A0AAV5JYK8_9ROSI|nr:hypothetical protein SLEP1_g29972 [Rubroshorea leprosula]